jgi:hypothetical protein
VVTTPTEPATPPSETTTTPPASSGDTSAQPDTPVSTPPPAAETPAETPASSALAIKVAGKNLVDGAGKTVQLRGVNVSGPEFVSVQGWSTSPWGGQTGDVTPNWDAMKTWKVNAVRIPLNEASWLGYQCTDASGKTRDPDPGHNYQATVKSAVEGATAAGMYVILDLHWTAPGKFCPLAQNPVADADHSIDFWKSIATLYKDQPNVLFELFNEPFIFWTSGESNQWKVLRDGGTFTKYVTGSASQYTADYTWKSAGMQQMIDAIRQTGATNVVLAGAPSWSQDLSQWVSYQPHDPLAQLAAVWHAYPNSGVVGSPDASVPKFGTDAYSWAQSVLDAGVPLVLTETGDHNAAGSTSAPFVSNVLPWADKLGASYLGWAWDVWGHPDNVLIKDKSGTPTDGFGKYFHDHLVCRGSGTATCP